jgi:superfamily I DNA and/or RNA helicase
MHDHQIAVGDPLQLPPVLESFADREDGLAKTLFIRLSTIGFPPIMLRTQYRVRSTFLC